MTVNSSEFFVKSLKSFEKVIFDIFEGDGVLDTFLTLESCQEALARVVSDFSDDFTRIQEDFRPIFSDENDIDVQTTQVADVLRTWEDGGAPSLCALTAFTVQKYFSDMTPDFKNALMMAGVLGEVYHPLAYHNNMHFRKVLFALTRLLVEHNEIYEGTPRVLDFRDAALMMIAACTHDLGHDGLGNTVKGAFHPNRLEQRSVDLATPFLLRCGLDENTDLAEMSVMVLCTDVTPLDDPASPARQMKAAYRYHYLGDGQEKLEALNLDEKIKLLETNGQLAVKSLLLHEADIATSAGLTYEVTKRETSLLMTELIHQDAKPSSVISFMKQVCNRQFLSDAGQRLHGANLSRIYVLAEDAQKDGDVVFCLSDDIAGGLSQPDNTSGEGTTIIPKTVN